MAGKTIGVLAVQGGYAAHETLCQALGHRTRAVRVPTDLAGLDGLVFPGGESSAMLKLIAYADLWDPLDTFVRSGAPVLATCAGVILAARGVTGPAQRSFGWLDVDVARNGWGRQVHSFEAQSDDGALKMIFIRAPRLTRVGPGVEVVATVAGEPVCVHHGPVVAATFHPELSGEPALHRRAFGG